MGVDNSICLWPEPAGVLSFYTLSCVSTSSCAVAFGVPCLSLPVLLFPFGVGSLLFTYPNYLVHLREESWREGGWRAP